MTAVTQLSGAVPGILLRLDEATRPIYAEKRERVEIESALSKKKIQDAAQDLYNPQYHILTTSSGAILTGLAVSFFHKSISNWGTAAICITSLGGLAGGLIGFCYKKESLKLDMLSESERFNSWKVQKTKSLNERAIDRSIETLNTIMLERRIVSNNYICHATGVFMRQPRTDGNGNFYAQGPGTHRNLQCKLLETDVLKLRFRFVEEIIATGDPALSPDWYQLLHKVQCKFKSEYMSVIEQVRAEACDEVRRVDDNEATQLRTWIRALDASKTQPNSYPFAAVTDQQRVTY